MPRPATGIRQIAILGLLLAGCETLVEGPPDPLVARIYDAASATELSREALFERVRGADVIYLGEQHDHPEHHRLQFEVIQHLVESGRAPSIGFERFPVTDSARLMALTQSKGMQASADIRALLGPGVDELNLAAYGRILLLARRHRLTIFGADLPVSVRSRITEVGYEALSAAEKVLIIESDLDDDNYRRLMYREFRDSHCGFGSDDYFARLYDNWTARNELMATVVVDTFAATAAPVVLLTGAGHTRYNRGVVSRAAALNPALTQLSIGLREVGPDGSPVEAYLGSTTFDGTDYGPDHPIIWFTARKPTRGPDPCEAFLRAKGEAQQEP